MLLLRFLTQKVYRNSVSSSDKRHERRRCAGGSGTTRKGQFAKEVIKDFLDTYKNTGGNVLILEQRRHGKIAYLSPVDARLWWEDHRGKVAMECIIYRHLLGDYSDTSFATMGNK